MRVGLEVGIDKVRDLPRMPVQLDQVRPIDLAQVRAGAALVHPEQRLERIEPVMVNIEGSGQELPERSSLAGIIDRLGIPRSEQHVVRLAAGFGEAHEAGRDVAVEADRHPFNGAIEVDQAGRVQIHLRPIPVFALASLELRMDSPVFAASAVADHAGESNDRFQLDRSRFTPSPGDLV